MNAELPKEGISIGAVSRATGIGVETLRMWERRYGAPQSYRLPSGHRRYPVEEVDRLRAVSEALKRGYRAGDVASLSIDDLLGLIERSKRLRKPQGKASEKELGGELLIDAWIDAASRYDDDRLTEELHREWSELGPLGFLNDRIAPFLRRLGEDWMNGELAVSHEHFASEKVGDFLASQWRRMNEKAAGPPLLVASFPGDLHRLGLQMCAVVATSAGRKVVYIGPQMPPGELVSAVEQFTPAGLCISVSSTMDSRQVSRALEELRLRLPASVAIVTGGGGAPEGVQGVLRMTDLEAFHLWCRTRGQGN